MTAKLLLTYLLNSTNITGIPIDINFIDQEQVYCLAENIYYEARSEDIKGQYAVASVTINRTNDSRFPSTVCEVVKQSAISKFTKKVVCAFSWYCENEKKGKDIPIENKDGSLNEKVVNQFKTAVIIAIDALNGNVTDNTNGATHFHNPSVSQPEWKNNMKFTTRLGNHDFYKLR